MDETDFIIILAWMRRLKLSGVEKIVFAIIYGFSKDRRSDFHGSRQYLADWCECSTKTIERALAHLEAMRYIIKREDVINGVKFCRYTVNFDTLDKMSIPWTKCPECRDNLSKTGDKMSPNNIDDNIDNNIAADNNARTREETPPKEKFNYKKELIKRGVTPENADRLMANRKAKRLANTQASFNKLMGAVEQVCNTYGVLPDEVIEFAGKKGWGYIDPTWHDVEGIKARLPRSMKMRKLGDFISNEMNRYDN